MTRPQERPSATILAFPVHGPLAERLARRNAFALLEREAAGVCDAAFGAWYHDAEIRKPGGGLSN